MKLNHLSLFLSLMCYVLFSTSYLVSAQNLRAIEQSQDANISWYNALDVGLTGQAWNELEHPYDRLPAKVKGIVRDPVWRLGTSTAGLSVHFRTNSTKILAKWTVRYDNSMWHMTDCGIKGVDLYMDDNGIWRYAGSGSPGSGKSYEREILDGLDGEIHQFHLNLPLYDGIDTLWIGVDEGSSLKSSSVLEGKPIVIYGTSIQQGGCASRPGMAASNILSRKLNREVINLGFSGNGRMEMELAELIAEIDAEAYILDCLPNIHNLEVIVPRYTKFIRFIREKRPDTPIFLVETATTVKSVIIVEDKKQLDGQNEQLRKAYYMLKQEDVLNLFIISGYDLIGTDGEGTVDGVHYTDLGFSRYAEKIGGALKKYR
ncbi:MAG: SGNH/GDSL hydrolase family protein [Bacteroidota bacterium]|nr:SGNH/GDSL hydrolase family protein [Bacteroidota bacterium]